MFLRGRRQISEEKLTLVTLSVTILSVPIKTFKCADTESLFRLRRVARFVSIERPALRKLKQLDLARRVEDLRAPPANRLEQLKGNRAGQWSIRVNDQFRICFRWTPAGAKDVEIVDYH
jgi:toxin HigB-1